MNQIVVTDRDGVEHTVEATEGWSVMEIIREAGLPIEALCGGCCSCSTCHVYVAPDWMAKLAPRDDDEDLTLEQAFDLKDESRLSCQIPYTDALNGLRVTLAPQ